MTCCPSCGAPLSPTKIIVDLDLAIIASARGRKRIDPSAAIILDRLVRAAGGFVAIVDLVGAVWPGANRPPYDEAANAVSALVSRAKAQIAPLGLSVVSQRGWGYRLVEIPEGV